MSLVSNCIGGRVGGCQAGIRQDAWKKMTLLGLDQWFSTEGNLASRGHLSGDVSDGQDWERGSSWDRGRGWGCCRVRPRMREFSGSPCP